MRILVWTAAVVVAAMVVLGIAVFMTLDRVPVHPEGSSVPSRMLAAPAARHEKAVAEARRLAIALVREENLPGLSIAVGVGGKVVWAEGFGYADIQQHAPVTPQTRFRIGTASKPLTAAAVGLLHQRGRLDLDAPVQQYVPAFPPKQWPVTTRQLMGHVAGLRHHRGERESRPNRHCTTTAQGLQLFAADPLLFRPGTAFSYSTYGWIVVSNAVESAAGVPFYDFMQREVFAPLGMRDTVPDGPGVPNRAFFYSPAMRGNTRLGLEPARLVDSSCFAGAGAFLSTPADLVRFGLAMLNGTLLEPKTVALLQTPLQLESGKSTGYGLGWSVEDAKVGHGGSATGGTASLLTFPEQGIVVAVTSNVSFAEGVAPLAAHIGEAFGAR